MEFELRLPGLCRRFKVKAVCPWRAVSQKNIVVRPRHLPADTCSYSGSQRSCAVAGVSGGGNNGNGA
jgi:hypothetical protein